MIIAPSKNCPCSTVFEVLKETEKAVQLRNLDIDSKRAFPVWVPKSAIGTDVIEFAPGEVRPEAMKVERKFFKPSAWRIMDKPWKRVALGLTTY